MDITFEIGDQDAPKGHAFIYFDGGGGEVWASYIVMLPITLNVAKYMPPFLMSQMGDAAPPDMSAFAFPPAPETLDGKDWMLATAEARGDDVLFGGRVSASDIPAMMMAVAEAVHRYSHLYNSAADSLASPDAELDAAPEPSGLGVSEVMYDLMSDGDRLNELTTLVGKLRFAVDSGDDALIGEAEADIEILSRRFSFDHKTDRIVSHIKGAGDDARRLSMLYLQRCYCFAREDYIMLSDVEKQIDAIEGGAPPPD